MVKAIRVYTLSYPLLVAAAFFATWLAARVSLGHWPRASLDDPKQIGGWFDVPYAITSILVMIGFPAFVLALTALAYFGFRTPAERARLLTTAGISLLLMLLVGVYIRWDPLRIGDWLLD